ncbi:HTH-type transcriptional repressor AseR [bacterium BMS3Abin07]|nr:HTH-type transcriptional repressor AseR [bacterium BMS3Abin07]GBE32671.1 HTH-type transcriptional repressor AseR [bacterium BMS3Bbin05]
MKDSISIFKLLSDETRLRILMLLDHCELSVCQLMGVLGVSQPLISRNLSLLSKGGFLDDRKDGKLVYYRIKGDLHVINRTAMQFLKSILKGDKTVQYDRETLRDCLEFQKKAGRCDMETFEKFIEARRKAVSSGR